MPRSKYLPIFILQIASNSRRNHDLYSTTFTCSSTYPLLGGCMHSSKSRDIYIADFINACALDSIVVEYLGKYCETIINQPLTPLCNLLSSEFCVWRVFERYQLCLVIWNIRHRVGWNSVKAVLISGRCLREGGAFPWKPICLFTSSTTIQ